MLKGAHQRVVPFRIEIDNPAILGHNTDNGRNAIDAKAIVTQAAVMRKGNLQFLHTINETIFAYVFGDRIDELQVAGVAFAELCRPDTNNMRTGMDMIQDIYEQRRVANRTTLLNVAIGEHTFRTFLIGLTLEANDPITNLGQWTMRFKGFPEGRPTNQSGRSGTTNRNTRRWVTDTTTDPVTGRDTETTHPIRPSEHEARIVNNNPRSPGPKVQ